MHVLISEGDNTATLDFNPTHLAELYLDYAGKLATTLYQRTGAGARRVGLDRDDYVQAARLGLVEAANDFEPDAGIAFETWAYKRIVGAILDELRQSMPRGYRQSGSNSSIQVSHAGERLDRMATCCPRLAEATARLESDDEVSVRLSNLTDRQRRIVESHLFGGLTFRGIAAGIGVCRDTAEKDYRAAIRSLALSYAAAS